MLRITCLAVNWKALYECDVRLSFYVLLNRNLKNRMNVNTKTLTDWFNIQHTSSWFLVNNPTLFKHEKVFLSLKIKQRTSKINGMVFFDDKSYRIFSNFSMVNLLLENSACSTPKDEREHLTSVGYVLWAPRTHFFQKFDRICVISISSIALWRWILFAGFPAFHIKPTGTVGYFFTYTYKKYTYTHT